MFGGREHMEKEMKQLYAKLEATTKREERLIADNERYERKRYDASNVYAGLFRDFTTLTELLNKNIKREEGLREALEEIRHCTAEGVGFPTIHTAHKIARNALQQED